MDTPSAEDLVKEVSEEVKEEVTQAVEEAEKTEHVKTNAEVNKAVVDALTRGPAKPEKKEEKPHHTPHVHHSPRKKVKVHLKTLNILLMVVIAVLIIFNLSTIANLNPEAAAVVIPDVIPSDLAKVSLTILSADCEECFSLDDTLTALRSLDLDLSEVEVAYDSVEGKALVKKYNLTGVPAILLKGDLDSVADLQLLPRTDDAVVLPAVPPYLNVKSGAVTGVVDITYVVKSDCEECFDVTTLTEQLEQFGLAIGEVKEVDVNTDEGKELVADNGITKVPTFMVSKDISVYTQLYEAWKDLGQELDDGSLLILDVTPPYWDLDSDELKGLVIMTNLVDESCGECYDVDIHSQILELRFGMVVSNKATVDVNSDEGRDLLEKYSITKVPTVLLSEDVKTYKHIAEMWKEIGTEESDGTFVFRGFDDLGETYKDLEKDEVVTGLGLTSGAVAEPVVIELDLEAEEEVAEEVVEVEEINNPPVLDLGLE